MVGKNFGKGVLLVSTAVVFFVAGLWLSGYFKIFWMAPKCSVRFDTNVSENYVAMVSVNVTNAVVDSYDVNGGDVFIYVKHRPNYKEHLDIPIRISSAMVSVQIIYIPKYYQRYLRSWWFTFIHPKLNESAKVVVEAQNVTLYKRMDGMFVGRAKIPIFVGGRCMLEAVAPKWLKVLLNGSYDLTEGQFCVGKGKYYLVLKAPTIYYSKFYTPFKKELWENCTVWIVVNRYKWIPINVRLR